MMRGYQCCGSVIISMVFLMLDGTTAFSCPRQLTNNIFTPPLPLPRQQTWQHQKQWPLSERKMALNVGKDPGAQSPSLRSASQFDITGDDDKNPASSLQDSPSSSSLSEQDNESPEKLDIWAARALLMFIAILWGTNFAAVKYLATLCFHPPCVHPPSEAAFARFGVAALVSIPLLVGQKKEIIMAGLECGFWITIGYISQAMALGTITAGKCAFICSLTVLVVPVLSAALYGKPLKPMHLIAAAVALSGVGILEGMIDFNALLGIQPVLADPGVTTDTVTSSLVTASAVSASATKTAVSAVGPLGQLSKALGVGKGDIIALGQPLGFGYTFIRIEHYVEKFKDEKNQILTLSAAQCVAVGALSLVWVLYDFGGTLPNFSYMIEPHRLAAIAWTGIVTTVVAIYLEGVALQTATATDAALTFSSEPVWASLFGMWLLHEQFGINTYVGGAVILVACVLGALTDLPMGENNNDEEVDAIDITYK